MLAVPVLRPVNFQSLPPAFARHFISQKYVPGRRIFILNRVCVSGEGVVFKNLRIFTPSLTWLRDLYQHRKGSLLLKQWQSSAKPLPATQTAALIWDEWSAQNHYHWMVESLPRLLLLQLQYPDCLLLVPEPAPAFVHSTIALMGFTKTFPLPRNKGAVISAERLLLPELVYYHEPQEAAEIPMYATAKKASAPTYLPPAGGAEELILTVKKKLLSQVSQAAAKRHRRVYVSRSRQKTRRLVNEEEVLSILQKWGFEIFYLEEMSFRQQLDLMRETSILLGVHGANMVNLLFLPPEACVIELMNQEHFNEAYYLLASSLNIPYFSVPCAMSDSTITPAADSVALNDAHLRVSPTLLEDTLKACLQVR